MYEIFFTSEFNRHYKKLTKNNKKLRDKTQKIIEMLQENPFYPSLKTHRATMRNNGEKWSSWITPDLRVAWEFEKNKTIILFGIGTHSGKHRVYN